MLHQILRINFRQLLKDRGYSLINVFGLTLGLTAFLLITIWVKDELTFDHFHSQADRIVRVVLEEKGEGGFLWTAASSPRVLATAIRENIPEVERVVRIHEANDLLFTAGAQTLENDAIFADPDFFNLFDFPTQAGNAQQALTDPQGVILTVRMANKLFGQTEVLGRQLNLQDTIQLTVMGIVEDLPSNTNFDFEILLPFHLVDRFRPNDVNNWNNWNYSTFLLLQEATQPVPLAIKMTQLLQSRMGNGSTTLSLQPLKEVHLHSNFRAADRGSSQLLSIYYLFGIGLLILFIACINYTNLSMARATQQTKTISIRKIIGASRGHLFTFFLGESVLLSLSALVFAVAIIQSVFPFFNQLTGKEMVPNLLSFPMLGIMAGSVLLTILLSGMYPAWMVASFSPIRFLRGLHELGNSHKLFRRGLLIGQFAISALLLIGTVFIFQQLQYMRQADLGFNQENILSFSLGKQMQRSPLSVKAEFMREPEIDLLTLTNQPIYRVGSWTDAIEWPGHIAKGSIRINRLSIDKDFYEVFDIKLEKGRALPAEGGTSSFLINETAARLMGMADPLGQIIRLNEQEGEVVGVVKDFHFRALHREIEPLILYHSDTYAGHAFIKTNTADIKVALAAAERIWKKFEPTRPFQYQFVDEAYHAQYVQEERISNMLGAAALICIFISLIGLVGLVAYSIARRTREIGVRKILGATVLNIFYLLGGDFLLLVLIGVGIAIPAAWYFLGQWLNEFAYRITLDPHVFILGGLTIVSLALLVLGAHTLRAANINPVEALRTE